MKYILILILLTGCVSTEDYYNGINSVEIGDSYQTIKDKIGDTPYDVNCYESARHYSCNVMYRVYNGFVVFRLDANDRVTSIYGR